MVLRSIILVFCKGTHEQSDSDLVRHLMFSKRVSQNPNRTSKHTLFAQNDFCLLPMVFVVTVSHPIDESVAL